MYPAIWKTDLTADSLALFDEFKKILDGSLTNKDHFRDDIETEKSWHEHFSYQDLTKLLEKNGPQFIDQDGFGYFNRPLMNLCFFLPGPLKKLIDPLVLLDSKLFSSTEIWVLVRKP